MSSRTPSRARLRAAQALALAALLAGCAGLPQPLPEYVGTDEPFAARPVYFVVTDRYVNGDPGNDHRDQGGEHPSFDLPLEGADGRPLLDAAGVGDNLGYLGGDFRGVLDNAATIRAMGFGAVWITPIVENPDQAYTGGTPPTWTSFLTDRGKSAYHGYWGINFWRVDEHLPSAGLGFREFAAGLRAAGLEVVLDVVANHGSPAFDMPRAQPQFGRLWDAEGRLVADHQNLAPEQLDPAGNPLHAFYRTERDLAQLSELDHDNPAVMDYLVGSTLQWIEQGAGALRLDTMKHVPMPAWKQYTDRIRARHPELFMFGEVFASEDDPDQAGTIAAYTRPGGAAVSVLDFPLMRAMKRSFGRERAGFELLAPVLHVDGGPYANVYELMTFYDNHDVARLDADDSGFIDAHHWLFTARGIPVVYYGSETGFMRGRAEHQGNRNYYGQARVDASRGHPIRAALERIAAVRAASPALQRGLMLPLELAGDRAAFHRVLQRDGVNQIALVLLNKGDTPERFAIDTVQPGRWRAQLGGAAIEVRAGAGLEATVAPHGAEVYLLDAPVTEPGLAARAAAAMARRAGLSAARAVP